VIFASTAVIFAAVYLLWLYQRLMLGPIENEKNRGLKDISKIELFSIIPIIVFIVWIGVKPNTFLSVSENSVKKVLTNFETVKARYQSEQKQLEEKEMQEKQMQEQK
jgi:NADH-quinone oxidoreductase subunit M